jgi:rubrerythrin
MKVESAAELYVHAMAIEREAAERYAEFATRMADQGNDELAGLFRALAGFEAGHVEALERRTQGVALPAPASNYQWLDAGDPQPGTHDLVFRLLTPRQAIGIALDAERRARDFFGRVQRSADDPALRALAREMAAEEESHIALLEQAAARAHDPFVDWASVFEIADQDPERGRSKP